MKQIPETENALVLRTDFSDDTTWKSLCKAIEELVGEFKAYVDFLSDPEYDGMGVDQLISLIPKDSDRTFIFVVDSITLSEPDHPIICVDLYDEPGRLFRVTPPGMWAVENNLTIANMDFEEFMNELGPDGVFRGIKNSE